MPPGAILSALDENVTRSSQSRDRPVQRERRKTSVCESDPFSTALAFAVK